MGSRREVSRRAGAVQGRRKRSAVAAAIVLLFAVSGAAQTRQEQVFHGSHPAMGSGFEMDVYAPDAATAERWMQASWDEVDRIEELLSNYRPTSELSRINREAGAHAVTTDPETFGFLKTSLEWSRRTDGAFDMTVGPLMRAWGFFFNNGRIPTDAELQALRGRVGWEKVVLTPATRSVRFATGAAMELDPGGIGKGYAVDRMVALLKEQHVKAALISAGSSSIYALGSPPDAPGWKVNVPDPAHPKSVLTSIFLKDESLATSACTEKFFIKDGHRYCHILNPRLMRPVEGMLQTTVVAPSATDTDALSTATFVMGAEASAKLLKTVPGASAVIVSGTDARPEYHVIQWRERLHESGAENKKKDRDE